MSDSTGHRTDDTAPAEKPWKKDTKNVPPLLWVVIAGLVVIIAVAFFYARGSMSTPKGGEVPVAADTAAPPQPADAAPAASS